MTIRIRDARPGDADELTTIANQYIHSRTTEWTERPHRVDERRAWIESQAAKGWPVLVAIDEDRVVGTASYSDFRDSSRREGYRFVVENSVHILDGEQGRGIGRRLMEELIDRARSDGKRTMVAAIDGETDGSIEFHRRLGFVHVGHLPAIGEKFGRPLDLVLMQLTL